MIWQRISDLACSELEECFASKPQYPPAQSRSRYKFYQREFRTGAWRVRSAYSSGLLAIGSYHVRGAVRALKVDLQTLLCVTISICGVGELAVVGHILRPSAFVGEASVVTVVPD